MPVRARHERIKVITARSAHAAAMHNCFELRPAYSTASITVY